MVKLLQKHGSNKTLKRSTELETSHEDQEQYLPDIVKEIFNEMEEFEKEKKGKVKTLSEDSGKPSSDTSNSSSLKRNSNEGLHKSSPMRKENRPSSKSGSGKSLPRRHHESPQLEAVRKMEVEKKTGQNTRKYNAAVEDEAMTAEDTATLLYDKSTKTWKLYKSAVNAQVTSYQW